MPKQIYTLNDFSGGLNNLKNSRDIGNNQFSDIQNAVVDMQGGIGISPRFKDYASTVPDIATTVPTAAGYGLGVFESDWEYTQTDATFYALGADELNGRGATWGTVVANDAPTDHGWDNSVDSWSASNWSVASNHAVKTSGDSNYIWYDSSDDSSYSNSLSAGETYRIIYTLSGSTSGAITFQLGNGAKSDEISDRKRSYIDLVAGAGTLTKILTITPTSAFNGTLDDIEVRLRHGGGANGGLFFSTTVDSAGDDVNVLTGWRWGNADDSSTNNVHLRALYPVGSWISISEAYVNQGAVLSAGSGASENMGPYQVIGSANAGASGSSLYLHRAVVTESNVKAKITLTKTTGETLILSADGSTGNIAVYTRVNPSQTWAIGDSGSPYANAIIDLRPARSANYSPPNHMMVKYYTANDAIRCCDTLKSNANVIKWFGFINFTQFQRTGGDVVRLGYEEHYNRLSPPYGGKVYTDSTSSVLADGTVNTEITNLPAGSGFSLFIKDSSDTGTYSLSTGQEFEFAQTFIYDGLQESLPKIYSETFVEADFTDDKAVDMRVIARGKTYNGRITGGRIYMRVKDSDDGWGLLLDMDLENGVRTSLDSEWMVWKIGPVSPFTNSSNDVPMYYVGTSGGSLQSQNPSIVTYEVINGYPADSKSNSFGDAAESWEHAIVANNRTFVCNVQYNEWPFVSGSLSPAPKRHPDRIMYSMPNRYDTFPDGNTIDAVRGDSDGYIALAEHADRLLAFKERSMQLINISSPSDANWFLEDSYKWMGVLHSEAVTKTPYGIVWMNPYGLYLYNGSSITNLIENTVDPSYWKPKITGSSILGYDPIKAHLLIQHNVSDSTTTGAIFDLKKNTYVKTANLITGTYTNMIVNPNDGNLFYGVKRASSDTTTQFDYYDGTDRTLTSALDNITFTTKDIDFGDPGTIKKVYKVIVSYKSNASIALYLKYYINGLNSSFGSATTFNTITADSASDWEIATFEITGGVVCQSFGLMFDTAAAGLTALDINDISIEFRVIGGRRVVAT